MQNDNVKFRIEFNKRLINFSLAVIRLCNEIRKDRNLWAVADQLIRSATSIGANIIEARASSSKLDYLKFFQISLKSANETQYWLILTKESCPSLRAQADKILSECEEISKIIGAGVLTMKGKR
ncbi:MAG: four helix bundle protein [Candidatus Staskawiczbacteria bacterium]|nr:four helix bundle protein [Candidatus Staskawiczbacteria bacterium]